MVIGLFIQINLKKSIAKTCMNMMEEKIHKFIKYFTTITKEECDYIEEILKWDDETKAAFFFAKRIFEEKE